MGIRALAAATALLVATSANAATVTRYTGALVFGDSLSDPGNLYAATGGASPPSPPYFAGRRSNGPVWAEYVTASFAAQGLAAANYAFAGATAVRNDDVAAGLPFQIPDLPDQLAAFGGRPPDLGDRPVGLLWFGANDVINAIGATPTPQAVGAAAAGAAAAVVDGIRTLRQEGVRDVVVMNLPSLEKVPAFTLGAPAAAPLAALGTDVFNQTLDTLIGDMKAKRRITRIDIEATFDDLIANPEKYGVKDAATPCIIPGVSVCSGTQADERAFFDLLHPNRIVQAGIADIVGAKAAPVPLPAPALLLLAALASLGVAGWRRQT